MGMVPRRLNKGVLLWEGNGLQGVKNTLTQERETGPAIPHPLNELELVHLTFNLPIGIDQREGGKDFIFVPLQSSSETLDIAEAACLYLLDPILEAVPFTLADDLPK